MDLASLVGGAAAALVLGVGQRLKPERLLKFDKPRRLPSSAEDNDADTPYKPAQSYCTRLH